MLQIAICAGLSLSSPSLLSLSSFSPPSYLSLLPLSRFSFLFLFLFSPFSPGANPFLPEEEISLPTKQIEEGEGKEREQEKEKEREEKERKAIQRMNNIHFLCGRAKQRGYFEKCRELEEIKRRKRMKGRWEEGEREREREGKGVFIRLEEEVIMIFLFFFPHCFHPVPSLTPSPPPSSPSLPLLSPFLALPFLYPPPPLPPQFVEASLIYYRRNKLNSLGFIP